MEKAVSSASFEHEGSFAEAIINPMALRQFTVTLLAGETRAIATHLPVSEVIIENETGNTLINFGITGLTSADYGGSVLAGPAARVKLGPFPHGLINLDDLYFLGAEGEFIHLSVVTP